MRHLAMTLVLITAFMAGPALADGQHSVKFIFKTDVKEVLLVQIYNGKDRSEFWPHREYKIKSGGTRTMKCHGQGKGRCNMRIDGNKTGDVIVGPVKIKDGSECTFSKIEGTPDDKYKYDQAGYKLTCTK